MKHLELMQTADRPRVCREGLELSAELIAGALTMEPTAAYRDVEDRPACLLQQHDTGPHHGLVASIRGDDAVWVVWGDGQDPHLVKLLDCPAEGTDSACTLYDQHPAGHSYELHDELLEEARLIADLLWPGPLSGA